MTRKDLWAESFGGVRGMELGAGDLATFSDTESLISVLPSQI